MTDQPELINEESIRIHPIECDFNQEWKPAAIFQQLTEIAGPAAAADPYRLATLVLKLLSHQITANHFFGIVYNELDILFLA
jgi:hypothetical protein